MKYFQQLLAMYFSYKSNYYNLEIIYICDFIIYIEEGGSIWILKCKKEKESACCFEPLPYKITPNSCFIQNSPIFSTHRTTLTQPFTHTQKIHLIYIIL